MKKHKRSIGQGLVEFALILPVILLVIVGTMEFARIFFLYVNLSNAAREASRYGMTNPTDFQGVYDRVLDTIFLMDPARVNIDVWYDAGPNTSSFSNPDQVAQGHRIIIHLRHNYGAMTALFDPFVGDNATLIVQNARTIQSVKRGETSDPYTALPTFTPAGGDDGGGGGGGGPTATIDPYATVPDVPTFTATAVPPTNTPSVPATATPTPIPSIIISRPVYSGTLSVGGTADANRMVEIFSSRHGVLGQMQVSGAGTFLFTGLPKLIAGETIMVRGLSGYYSQDLVVVGDNPPTPTPTATATPSVAFIALDQTCINGSGTIVISGDNWTDKQINIIRFYLDGATGNGNFAQIPYDQSGGFSTSVTLSGIAPGTHTISAQGYQNQQPRGVRVTSAPFISPCPATPTPIPTVTPQPTPANLPDLVVTNLKLQLEEGELEGWLGTYEPLSFDVTVANIGGGDATALFWINLYADPELGASAPPITAQYSVDYVALNALAEGGSLTFTMYIPNGFAEADDYLIVAYIDPWNQIHETNEGNNQSAPLPISIDIVNVEPTPTTTPEVPPGDKGQIAGTVLLNGFTAANVPVYVYDSDGRLRSSVITNADGEYISGLLPAGIYRVEALVRQGDQLYWDVLFPVEVFEGMLTTGADLDL